MIKLTRSVLILSLCMVNAFARCQYTHYEAIDRLCATADEILLINIVEDKPDVGWSRLSTCFSFVKATVADTFKITKFSGAHELVFRRMMSCVDTLDFPKEKLLKIGQPYIVFLSSWLSTDDNPAGTVKYSPSDYILGIQESNDDLYQYLKLWQKQQRRKK